MPPNVFQRLLDQLPSAIQKQALTYRNWQDRQRSVIGKNLLLAGLSSFEIAADTLKNLRYSEFQRPYLGGAVDFNISHGHDFTVCAISDQTAVGIDIEKVRAIDLSDFESQFSRSEWNALLQREHAYGAFFKLWTQKEAFAKAIGKGFQLPFDNIEPDKNRVLYKNQPWYLKAINLHPAYYCHLCTSIPSPSVVIREVCY